MPRYNRLDFPGAFQHVIARGIEQKHIFESAKDKSDFFKRLKLNLQATQTKLYAWVLMENHFHLLTQTGAVPLADFMRKLLTGYAVSYNKRHQRVGHLFQNRYKSIVCDKEEYFLRLIQYIHLNPVRAKLIRLNEVKNYPFSGHQEIIELETEPMVERDEILSHFGDNYKSAIASYERFIQDGVGLDVDFNGGGLSRSVGKSLEKISQNERQASDERILGDGEFVKTILDQTQQAPFSMAMISTIEELSEEIAKYFNLNKGDIKLRNKLTQTARDLFVYLGKVHLNLSLAELGRFIRIKRMGASMAFQRGKNLNSNLDIEEKLFKS